MCASWFRQLARAIKTCRLYRSGNPLVQSARANTVDLLLQYVHAQGGWQLRFQPDAILLGQEQVVGGTAAAKPVSDVINSPESRLPILFYRDGIRGLTILPGLHKAEAQEFFDALVAGCSEKLQTDDLVTLLWQANLSNISVEAAPIEQAFYLSGHASTDQGLRGSESQVAGAASGAEVRASLNQETGAQNLHVGTFDDWALAQGTVIVPAAFESLSHDAEAACRATLDQWGREKAREWDARVPELFLGIIAADPSEDTRAAFASSAATWAAAMIEQHHLARAARALELLGELDPGYLRSSEVLARGLEQVDVAELADYLDEAEHAEQGRFAALMVQLGPVAVPLAYSIMGRATRSRLRAAAATALCYQCADTPELLAPFLHESQAEAMMNLVFVLGQIGGSAVAGMLRTATQHADPRVRRQAVLSLGGVPQAERTPVLLDELARLDPHILSTTLSMLARQKDENVTRFIMSLINDPDFENRGEDVQRAMFSALTEVAGDSVVPVLEKLMNRNQGWLGRRSYMQFGAALALRRLGTPVARNVLEMGLNSRNAATRSACVEAMNAKAA